jgi:hypothetical protein
LISNLTVVSFSFTISSGVNSDFLSHITVLTISSTASSTSLQFSGLVRSNSLPLNFEAILFRSGVMISLLNACHIFSLSVSIHFNLSLDRQTFAENTKVSHVIT